MISQKFLQSRQTLFTDRLSDSRSSYKVAKHSSQAFINPYPIKPQLKFPKDRNVRRQTQMNALVESSDNPERFCMKPTQKANRSTLNDLQQTKRISKFGSFNPLSKSVDQKHPKPVIISVMKRTFEDIGVNSNMRKTQFIQKFKPDPIIVGQTPSRIYKCNSTIWKQQRRLRDNGQIAKQQLIWKVDPQVKRAFYSGKNKNTQNDSTKSVSDFTKVLNYQRRK